MSPRPLYISIGQSNSVGAGTRDALPANDTLPDHSVGFWYLTRNADGSNVRTNGGWGPLDVNDTGTHGPERTFGRDIRGRLPLILKFSVNGTGLGAYWVPGEELYSELVARVQTAIALSTVEAVPRAVLWTGGEGDSTVLSRAAVYDTNLAVLIEHLRIDLACPELRFWVARLCNAMSRERGPYIDLVRAKTTDFVSTDPLSQMVDTDALSVKDDGVHYTALAQQALGSLFASLEAP